MDPTLESICFAVAVDIASWVIPQLLQHGRVRRGCLGVAGATQTLDRRVVLASSVEPSSPAAVVYLTVRPTEVLRPA